MAETQTSTQVTRITDVETAFESLEPGEKGQCWAKPGGAPGRCLGLRGASGQKWWTLTRRYRGRDEYRKAT